MTGTGGEVQAILDNIWMLIAGALVFFIQAGFALVEAGLTRQERRQHLRQEPSDMVIGGLAFVCVGYAFSVRGNGVLNPRSCARSTTPSSWTWRGGLISKSTSATPPTPTSPAPVSSTSPVASPRASAQRWSGRASAGTRRTARCARLFACTVTVWIKNGKPDLSMIGDGILAGLVGITAGCGTVNQFGAIVIGTVAGVLVVFAVAFVAVVAFDRVLPHQEDDGPRHAGAPRRHGGDARGTGPGVSRHRPADAPNDPEPDEPHPAPPRQWPLRPRIEVAHARGYRLVAPAPG